MISFAGGKQRCWCARHEFWVCLVLATLILAVYLQVIHFDFVSLDDTTYVAGNRHVRTGINPEAFFWSFRTTDCGNWHPLTWLSHMADVQCYGLHAGSHHLTNVLIHIVNTLLLFFLLRSMTRILWPSVFVAALFALHPIHVESVAWVSERKDVLSTFFGLLTLISYMRYTRQRSRSAYMLAMLFFMLGLMAKPMLVTLPFLLLLLDYWPLGRVNFRSTFRLESSDPHFSVLSLFSEKIPFFLFTAASCMVTYYAQHSGGAVRTFDLLPLGLRISNAVISYIAYMAKMFWPVRLSVFYPYPHSYALWKIAAAAAVLTAIFILVIMQIRRRPYLAVGWLWYFGALLPVIGLVQVGDQAMADRYTYIPLIGLFIMIVWGADDLFGRWRVNRIFGIVTAIILILALSVVSHIQVSHWANNIALFSHAVKVTRNNYLAHLSLGKALHDAGREQRALQHYTAALQINPYSTHALVNLGSAFLAQGKIGEAMDHFKRALEIQPDFAEAHNNLGLAMVRIGQIEESIHHFRRVLKANPGSENALKNLNLAIAINNKINRAVRRMREFLQVDALSPGFDLKMIELSNRKRDVLDAAEKYRKALSKQPGFNKSGGKDPAAVAAVLQEYEGLLPFLLEKARFQPVNVDVYYHVACIYARKGRIHESNQWINRARAMDSDRWRFFQADPDLLGIQESGSDLHKYSKTVHFAG